MSTLCLSRALSPYATSDDVLRDAAATVAASPFVRLTGDLPTLLVSRLRVAQPAPFVHMLGNDARPRPMPPFPGSGPLAPCDVALHERAWRGTVRDAFTLALTEYAVDAAMNGGYWYTGTDGATKQWNRHGSGSQAMGVWLDDVWQSGLLPGRDLVDDDATLERELVKTLMRHEVPYLVERLALLQELGSSGAQVKLRGLLLPALSGTAVWDWGTVRTLQAALPACFGEDPLGKKALLYLLYLWSWLAASGITVRVDLLLPADYQMPRIFEFHHLIEMTEAGLARLTAPALLAQDDPFVRDLRAATVLVGRQLAMAAGVADHLVDLELFSATRANPAFRATAVPVMRVATMWF